MSHVATHWLATVPPKDMTHGEFRVLFHLCDCHNPSMGCFPKQAYLRDHTGLSNGGLNKALGELERKGLIQREKARDEQTKRQKPTQYFLGFELDETVEPPPLSGGGAVSTSDAEPSPLLAGSVSTTVESYTKDKPVKEPVREPCARQRVNSNFLNAIVSCNASIARSCPVDVAQTFISEKQVTLLQCRAAGIKL